jgi:hypothetical protein
VAAGVQTRIIGPPNAFGFGRDPNDCAIAIDRPPNDPSAIFRFNFGK